MTNVDDSLDGAYLEWLYSKVSIVLNKNPTRSYWQLLLQLYTTRFIWFVPNDDNRAEDGRQLRVLFLEETGFLLDDPYDLFMSIDCSMLEMLIALSNRAAFESNGSLAEWFWRLMHNLELDTYSDAIYEISIQEEINEVMCRLNDRTYSESGMGGLFPLRNPEHDQRRVEIWYQMHAYLIEGLYQNVSPRF